MWETWPIHVYRHDSFICVTWLIHMCDVTHSYKWHGPFIFKTWLLYKWETWLIHTCDMTHSYVWHDSFIQATRPFHVYRHDWFICERHDSFTCVTWLMHISDTTLSCVRHDSFICERHDSFICIDMTHSYVWHDSSICVTRLLYMWETWLIHMWDMSHSYV